jgi:hypothetical protein
MNITGVSDERLIARCAEARPVGSFTSMIAEIPSRRVERLLGGLTVCAQCTLDRFLAEARLECLAERRVVFHEQHAAHRAAPGI